jgi:PH domain
MKVGGQKGVRNWQKRWVVLQDHTLSYFKNQRVSKVSGEVDMRTVSGVEAEAEVSKKKPNALAIYTPSRTYYFQCKSPNERAAWIDALRSHMSTTTVCSPAISPHASPRDTHSLSGGATSKKPRPLSGPAAAASTAISASVLSSASPSSRPSSTATATPPPSSSSSSSSTSSSSASSPSGPTSWRASTCASSSSPSSSRATAPARGTSPTTLDALGDIGLLEPSKGGANHSPGKAHGSVYGVVQHSGPLLKVGGKKVVKSNWQRRYVVLRERALLYYRSKPKQDTDKPAGMVLRQHIEGSEALDEHTKRHAYCFCVLTTDRTFYFAAEDDADRVRWLTELSSLPSVETI